MALARYLLRGGFLFLTGVFFAFVLKLLQVQRQFTSLPQEVFTNMFSSTWWLPPTCGTAAGKFFFFFFFFFFCIALSFTEYLFAKLGLTVKYKAGSIGHPVKIEPTNNSLLSNYPTCGAIFITK